jgi:hypothetical protein
MLWLALVASAVVVGLSVDVVPFTATFAYVYVKCTVVVALALPAIWLWWGAVAAIAWFFIRIGAAALGGASVHGRYLWHDLLLTGLRAGLGLAAGLLVRSSRARWSSRRPAWPSKDPSDYR